ncbi:MAG: alpha/beta hydrolase [Chitinophagales bacterium]
MKQKLYLLPGFGEDHRCFRNLKPFLRDYELVDVDYRPILQKIPIWDTTPTQLAKGIIRTYGIQPTDILIGHSMGGYFSHVISHLEGNDSCLIGSFTDPNKIIRLSQSKLFNTLVTGSGLVKTPIMRKYIAERPRDERIKREMLTIHKNFNSFSNMAMAQLSILSFGEDLPPSSTQPLHIHAKDDTVVRPPDAPYEKVRGGHFCLVFHPDEVHEKMQTWLTLSN